MENKGKIDERNQSPAPLLDFCPKCGTPTQSGYGLAGGGMGPYVFCPSDTCGEYFAKLQDHT